MSDMDTRYTRTTITLPKELLYEIKKKALAERKTAKEIINKSLESYLGHKKVHNETSLSLASLFGAWGKGESGNAFLTRVRYGKKDKKREEYVQNLWKRS